MMKGVLCTCGRSASTQPRLRKWLASGAALFFRERPDWVHGGAVTVMPLQAWRLSVTAITPAVISAKGARRFSRGSKTVPLRAVYRIKLEKKVFATKDRELVAGIVLSTGCGPRAMALERPAEPNDCLRAEINKIKCLLHCFIQFQEKQIFGMYSASGVTAPSVYVVVGWLLHSCSWIWISSSSAPSEPLTPYCSWHHVDKQ